MNTKPDHEKRSTMISVMVTPELAQWLRLQAAKRRKSLSTAVYSILVDTMTQSEIHAEGR